MKHCKLERSDLIGFLDSDEYINEIELSAINKEYNRLVDNASQADKDDYTYWCNNEGYYPPFVAESINNILGGN